MPFALLGTSKLLTYDQLFDSGFLDRYNAIIKGQGMDGSAPHTYQEYVAAIGPKARLPKASRTVSPMFSVVIPCLNPEKSWLSLLLRSLERQGGEELEVILVDDSGHGDAHLLQLLGDRALEYWNDRLRLYAMPTNAGISAATNAGATMSRGQWIVLADHDDELAENVLSHIADIIERRRTAKWIYTDEDKLHDGCSSTDAKARFNPYFKPALNRTLSIHQYYPSHLAVIRRDLWHELGGLRSCCDGSQDFDLWLRALTVLRDDEIVHLPYVGYHWREVVGSTASSPYAKNACVPAAMHALKEFCVHPDGGNDVNAEIVEGYQPLSYRIKWSMPMPAPMISILIPTRNGLNLLRSCLDSFHSTNDYQAYEIIVIDNGSDDPEALAWLQSWALLDSRHVVVRDPSPFNYSALNNRAVKQSRGSLLLFCNNDILFDYRDCLNELVRQIARPGVAAVGAQLLYDDHTIQHAGVVLGLNGAAGHVHLGLAEGASGHHGRALLPQEVSAVTAALMMVRREAFEQIGGFNEVDFPVAFNDVDLCLMLREANWKIVYTPYAKAVHLESKSRGSEDTQEKRKRFAKEIAALVDRWGEYLGNDPYYSPNLALNTTNCFIRDPQLVPINSPEAGFCYGRLLTAPRRKD
jgi:GT2 family glycosyltransferase